MSTDALAEGLRASYDAFNARDYATAFAALSPDIEWHPGDWVMDSGDVIRGRDAVVRFYEQLADAGDWQLTLREVTDLGGGRVMTHQVGIARGRTTGIELERESFLVWTRGEDGLIVAMHEFATREEALAAFS